MLFLYARILRSQYLNVYIFPSFYTKNLQKLFIVFACYYWHSLLYNDWPAAICFQGPHLMLLLWNLDIWLLFSDDSSTDDKIRKRGSLKERLGNHRVLHDEKPPEKSKSIDLRDRLGKRNVKNRLGPVKDTVHTQSTTIKENDNIPESQPKEHLKRSRLDRKKKITSDPISESYEDRRLFSSRQETSKIDSRHPTIKKSQQNEICQSC